MSQIPHVLFSVETLGWDTALETYTNAVVELQIACDPEGKLLIPPPTQEQELIIFGQRYGDDWGESVPATDPNYPARSAKNEIVADSYEKLVATIRSHRDNSFQALASLLAEKQQATQDGATQ